MEIGMLWYDDSPIPLKENVKQAASYYVEKYGRKPNLCLVHPGMLQTEEGKVNGVQIRKGRGVMRGHLWIGVDETQVKSNGKKVRKPSTKAKAPEGKAARGSGPKSPKGKTNATGSKSKKNSRVKRSTNSTDVKKRAKTVGPKSKTTKAKVKAKAKAKAPKRT